MRSRPWILAVGLLPLVACGDDAISSLAEAPGDPVQQTLSSPDSGSGSPSSAETLPKLIDPSTDIEAIDRPVVLWFWSPG